MKHLFVLILLIFVQNVLLQAQKNPDLSEEISELKNDIKELESEIADARVNYPEDVPELQKELAASKKMLSAFEKMSGMPSGPQPAVAKAVPSAKAAYNSPIVPINLNQPVITPSPGEATDRLLWYTGKKINDSTIVTTRAMVVQYQPKKNRVVAQPNTGSDPFKSLIEELEKSEQRKDELIDIFSKMKNGALYYPNLLYSLRLYDDLEKRYNEVAENTIELPFMEIPNLYKGGGFDDIQEKDSEADNLFEDILSDEIQDVIDRINAALKRADELEAQLPPVGDFPAPPRKDIGICATCDSTIIKREYVEDTIWSKAFMEKEREIILIRLSAARQMELIGMDEVENLLPFSLLNRMSIKVKLLFDRYGNNFEYAKTVYPLALGLERQKQLLGIEDESSGMMQLISRGLNFDYAKILKEQMGLKNYNFALDLPQHIGLARQRALLGVEDEDDAPISKEFDMAMDFNRFALTLDLDFVFEKVDDDDELELNATGSISTKDKVYVRVYPDKCNWRIILFKTDYWEANEQRAAIPLVAKSGSKTIRDEDDNLVTFDYSGPEDMVAYLPEFKIDLCDLSKKDSAFMMPINYTYGYVPKSFDLRKNYKEDMLAIANHIFIDINKMEDNASRGMEMAAEIIENVSQSQVTDPTGNPKLDKMQGEYNLKLKQDEYKKEASEMGMNKKSVFLFNANNGSTVFIDQTNDAKHQIDDYTKLVKGQIHLRLVHDPLE